MARADWTANRQRLLVAVRDSVAEQGKDVSVREIAARAGLGLTTLYRHFPDKEALIDAVSVQRWATMAGLAERHATDGAGVAGVIRSLETFSRMVASDEGFIAGAELRVGVTPLAIRPVKARFEPAFALAWARAQRTGEIRRGFSPIDAMVMAGTLQDRTRRESMLRILLYGICTDNVASELIESMIASSRTRHLPTSVPPT